MLILSRRVGEGVVIGETITVTVLDVKGHQARLGIRAPDDVPVHRTEVRDRIGRTPSARDEGRRPEPTE